jgi:excisionase family DNA binding protein
MAKKRFVGMSTHWLSVEDIAEELKVKIDTVRGWIRRKELIAYRVGNTYRIKQEDFDKFLEQRRTAEDKEK